MPEQSGVWVPVLLLPLVNYGTSGKLLHPSITQCSYLKNGAISSLCLIGMIGGI